MATSLPPIKKGESLEDLGQRGNLVSRRDRQHTAAMLKAYNVARFQNPDLGYIIADGRMFVQTIEAIEFTIRSKDYAKGDPAAKEEMIKTRDAYLHILVYNERLFAKEGKLRLHECMLSQDHFLERQTRKKAKGLTKYLEYWEHQMGIRIILNIDRRRPTSATGEIDIGETSTSEHGDLLLSS